MAYNTPMCIDVVKIKNQTPRLIAVAKAFAKVEISTKEKKEKN